MKKQKDFYLLALRHFLCLVSVGVALIGLVAESQAAVLQRCERLPQGAYIGDQALLWSSSHPQSLPVLQEVHGEFHGPKRIYVVLYQQMLPGKTRLLVYDGQKRTGKLRVLAKLDDKFSVVCQVDNILLPPPGQGGSIFRIDADNSEQLWRVEVEYSDVEETHAETEIVLHAFSDHKSSQEFKTVPICRTIAAKQFKPLLTTIKSSRSETFISGITPPTAFYVNSNNEIILKIEKNLSAKVPINGRVRMLVKVNESDASYAPACEVDFKLAPGTQSVAIAGWAADSRFINVPVTWRIEVFAASQSTAVDLRLSTLHINRNFGNAVVRPRDPHSTPAASEFICHDSTNIPWGGEIGAAPFSSRSTLEAVVLDTADLLTAAARSKIHKTILDAMALWRRVCRDCSAWNLVAARIDEDVYVLQPIETLLTHYLGPERSNRQADDSLGRLISPQEYYQSLSIWLNARAGASLPILAFKKLEAGSRALETLCKAPEIAHYDKVQELRLGLCKGESEAVTSSKIALKLLIRNGHTSCGFNKDIVACEADPVLMELNARDYSFVDYLSGENVFGLGSRAIALLPVVIHELGHWIGLPHIQEHDAIMSASAEDARCITHFDANALLKAFENGDGPAPRQLDAFHYRSTVKRVSVPKTKKRHPRRAPPV